MWAVVRPDFDLASVQMCLWDTGVGSTSQVGAALFFDTVRGRIGLAVENGLGDGSVLDYVLTTWWTRDNVIQSGHPFVLVVVCSASAPHYSIFVNGRRVGTVSFGDRWKDGVGPALSSAAATNPIRLFQSNQGLFQFSGHLGEIGFTSSAAPQLRTAVENALGATYGLTMDRTNYPNFLVDGNSLMDDFWRKESHINLLPQSIQNAVEAVYGPIQGTNRAVAGLDTEEMTSRAARHVTPNYDPHAPWNVLLVWEMLNSVDDGTNRDLIYAHYKAYCQARRAEGWKVISVPCLPISNALFTEQKLDDVDYLRSLVASTWNQFSDAFVNVHTDPILGKREFAQSTTWRYDGVHFNDTGNALAEPYFINTTLNLISEILMSIGTVVDADYASVINTMRSHLANGTQPSANEMRLAIEVVKKAVAGLSTMSTQFAILNAFTGASDIAVVVAAIATAEAARPTVPAYVTSTLADG
jgi:hypothetical protein